MPRQNWTEIAAFEVPEGQVFWFERFGVSWEEAAAAGNVHFGVCIDDSPIGPGFGDFTHQPGDLNFLDMCHVQQRYQGPAKVTIEARNAGVADYTVYGRLFGFIGPNRPSEKKG